MEICFPYSVTLNEYPGFPAPQSPPPTRVNRSTLPMLHHIAKFVHCDSIEEKMKATEIQTEPQVAENECKNQGIHSGDSRGGDNIHLYGPSYDPAYGTAMAQNMVQHNLSLRNIFEESYKEWKQLRHCMEVINDLDLQDLVYNLPLDGGRKLDNSIGSHESPEKCYSSLTWLVNFNHDDDKGEFYTGCKKASQKSHMSVSGMETNVGKKNYGAVSSPSDKVRAIDKAQSIKSQDILRSEGCRSAEDVSKKNWEPTDLQSEGCKSAEDMSDGERKPFDLCNEAINDLSEQFNTQHLSDGERKLDTSIGNHDSSEKFCPVPAWLASFNHIDREFFCNESSSEKNLCMVVPPEEFYTGCKKASQKIQKLPSGMELNFAERKGDGTVRILSLSDEVRAVDKAQSNKGQDTLKSEGCKSTKDVSKEGWKPIDLQSEESEPTENVSEEEEKEEWERLDLLKEAVNNLSPQSKTQPCFSDGDRKVGTSIGNHGSSEKCYPSPTWLASFNCVDKGVSCNMSLYEKKLCQVVPPEEFYAGCKKTSRETHTSPSGMETNMGKKNYGAVPSPSDEVRAIDKAQSIKSQDILWSGGCKSSEDVSEEDWEPIDLQSEGHNSAENMSDTERKPFDLCNEAINDLSQHFNTQHFGGEERKLDTSIGNYDSPEKSSPVPAWLASFNYIDRGFSDNKSSSEKNLCMVVPPEEFYAGCRKASQKTHTSPSGMETNPLDLWSEGCKSAEDVSSEEEWTLLDLCETNKNKYYKNEEEIEMDQNFKDCAKIKKVKGMKQEGLIKFLNQKTTYLLKKNGPLNILLTEDSEDCKMEEEAEDGKPMYEVESLLQEVSSQDPLHSQGKFYLEIGRGIIWKPPVSSLPQLILRPTKNKHQLKIVAYEDIPVVYKVKGKEGSETTSRKLRKKYTVAQQEAVKSKRASPRLWESDLERPKRKGLTNKRANRDSRL